jgi:hypothetical protein
VTGRCHRPRSLPTPEARAELRWRLRSKLRHHSDMAHSGAPGARPGWVRDAPVPHALSELRGSLRGNIGLPARMFWSGPNPRAIRWNLAEPSRRRDLYEIVLVEGTLDDIRTLINGAELVRLWDQMYLPPWVRAAWQPLIDTARTAA